MAQERRQGVFITFEGGDGVGKTTQVALLRDWLAERGHEVVCLHEPGGTALGEKIRALLLGREQDGMDPRAELLLFEAARAQLVSERVRPALDRGAVVVCDRFTDSTVAYQGYGRGLGAGLVGRLNALATGGVEPDLTVLLAMDANDSQERVMRRSGASSDRMEAAGPGFRARVAGGFSEIAFADPARVRVVDASRAVGDVHRDIVSLVAGLDAMRAVPEGGRR